MTQSFSELVGKGSFGRVYRGLLQHISVAVRVLDPVGIIIHVYTYIPPVLCDITTQKALQDIMTELHALTRYYS